MNCAGFVIDAHQCDQSGVGSNAHRQVRNVHDPVATKRWAEKSTWLGLEIVSKEGGGEGDDAGRVQFTAKYSIDGNRIEHREIASFARHDGRWMYVDGATPKQQTVVNDGPRIGRNDPCPCGSGKKAKKCCAA